MGGHYRLEGKGGEKGTKACPGLWKKDRRRQFSVIVGTASERSKLPLELISYFSDTGLR